MNFCKTMIAASVAAACVSTAFAADPKMPEKPAIPTLGQIMEATGISVNGYIDASYTSLSGSGTFTGAGVANRVFDTERRSFNVNALDLTISALPPEGFGGMVNLTAGTDAKVIAAAGAKSCTATATSGTTTCTTADEFDMTQAYVHYAKGGLMVIGGKYVTLSGAEVIKSPANLNFSRSILFGYAIPFTHTGVRAYYTPGGSAISPDGKPTFIVGLNNGWDVLSESKQAAAADGSQGVGKTWELGVSGNATKDISLAAVFYRGNESTGALQPLKTGQRDLLDIVATFTVSDALSFTLNYDTASQEKALAGNKKAKWNGTAGYVNYKLSDAWRVAFRTESFDDKNGFRTGVTNGQKWKENTLTLANTPAKNVELRGELRYDKSDKASFNQISGSAKKSQNSLGLEAIYKF